MAVKGLKKEYNPQYGWVVADTKKSKGFKGFTSAQELYNKLYGAPKVDKKGKPIKAPQLQKEYLAWEKPAAGIGMFGANQQMENKGSEFLRWAEAARNEKAMQDPVYKAIIDAQAKNFTRGPQPFSFGPKRDLFQEELDKLKKKHGTKAFERAMDQVAAAQQTGLNKTGWLGIDTNGPIRYSAKTNEALRRAKNIEGDVDFKTLLLSDPNRYANAALKRYYDSPNASLISRDGGDFTTDPARNASKIYGGEDLADDVFRFYQAKAKAGELGQDWAAVDGNQYLQKGTFGGKEAFFTPYDYAIHGVPTAERGQKAITNIANLDPNYWAKSGNLQKIGDKYGFITEVNPFANVASANKVLKPEAIEFIQKTSGGGGLLGGGLGSVLGLGAQALIGGGLGALNPLGAFNPSVFSFGLPGNISTVAGLAEGSKAKSPKTWVRQTQAPNWKPQEPVPQPVQQPAQQTTQPVQMAQGGMVGNTMNFNPVQAGNPVAQSAQGLASLGRNNDSMLMHVTPNEVAGLQGLAQQLGGSLSVNPQTGLPEAGFFDGIGDFLVNLLPTAAGAAVGFGTGNPLLGATVAGGLKTAQTGDIGQGILSGIGAYIGAGTVGDIAKMGAQSTALPAATTAAAPALTSGAGAADLLGSVTPAMTSTPIGQGGLSLGGAGVDLAQPIAAAATPSFSDFTSGLSALTEPGGFTQFAQQTGSSPLGAGFKLASPFIGAGVETLAQQGALGPKPIEGMEGFGSFTPIEQLRKRYAGNIGMAQGGMVPKQFGVSNQQGITALPIGQVSQPFQTFTGYNPTRQEPVTNAPEYNSVSSGLSARFKQGGYLDGAGDGMSDDIPATIEGKQPARLADGEFVVPADVVSHLGNGSTKAGAKRLYAMMDKVRHARTGTKKQGKKINADKYLPT